MNRVDLLKRLADADIAFAEVNTMADLATHPHLRRIEVDTPKGKISYAAPAAIFVGENRHYGAVPAIGEHVELPKASCTGQIVMTEKLDLDHLRGWIGKTTEASDIVTAQLVKGLRATLFQEIGEPEDRRRRALDHALVPGAAGVSDVDARPGRPPDPRRLPAAGAAAAPDVGRRRTRIPRCAARRR